jgi:hypothetical protein
MGEDARLDDAVAALNAQLGDITPYKLAVVDPAALVPVEKNAHYLPKATFDRLADNIARDGNLSTLPFCWRTPAGDYIVLSGNHRRAPSRWRSNSRTTPSSARTIRPNCLSCGTRSTTSA